MDFSALDPGYLARLVEEDRRRQRARACVERLRGTSHMINLITTGAAGDLIPTLWGPPGASDNMLTGTFSYAKESTDDLVGGKADGYANTRTARLLATEAYFRGAELAARRGRLETDVVGVAMSAAVTTGRVLKGDDRVHIALRTSRRLWHADVVLDKPHDHAAEATARRLEEGSIADLLTLNATLAVLGLPQVDLPQEGMESEQFLPGGNLGWLMPQEIELPRHYVRDPFDKVLWPDGTVTGLDALSAEKHVLFPASINPLTYAHDHMARAIRKPTGRTAVFQLSLAHPNKVVTPEELVARAAQLMFRHPVVLLREHGLYVEKAELFPGMPMMIGADAVMEMMEERHYGGYLGLVAALKRMAQLGTEFHVNGRLCPQDGIYRECDDLKIPMRYGGMFHPFTERLDVSSSARRAAGVAV